MPRVNRRRQPLGYSAIAPGSPLWQLLTWGFVLLRSSEDPVFDSEAEELAAWRQNRERLIAEARPGCRPAAYFRWDLGVNPPPSRTFQGLRILLNHELIGAAEAVAIEREYPILRADSANYGSAFETPEGVLRIASDRHCLNVLHEELDLARAWHQWRGGREELAKQFATRAAVVLQVATERAA